MAGAIDKLRKRINDHHATLERLRALYAADGHIDAKERQHLNALKAQVAALDATLAAKSAPGGAPGSGGFADEPQFSEDPMMSSMPEEEDEILMSSENQGVVTLDEVEIIGTIEPSENEGEGEITLDPVVIDVSPTFADEFEKEMKAEEIGEKFGDAFDKIGNPQDITDFNEGFAEIVETTGEMMGNAGRALQELGGIGEDVEKQSQKNGEAQEMIGAVTGEIVEMFGEATGEVAGNALESVGDLIQGLGDAGDQGYEGVDAVLDGDILEGAQKIHDGVTGIQDATLKGLGNVGEGMAKGAYEVVEGAVEINNEITSGILENLGIIDDDEDDND